MEIGEMPKGSIENIIGREMVWEDEPIEVSGGFLLGRNVIPMRFQEWIKGKEVL
jgi:hypothetical protein